MICCAIAGFIVGQIYLAWAGVRERLFGVAAPSTARGAAAWRFDDPPTATSRFAHSGARRRAAAAVLTLACLMAVVCGIAMTKAGPEQFLRNALICGSPRRS